MTSMKIIHISIIPKTFLVPLCNLSLHPYPQATYNLLSFTRDQFKFSTILK